MHLKRWLSGLILAPSLILFILYAPPYVFLLFILALVFIGLREYYALSLPGLSAQEKGVGILLGLLPPVALYSQDPRCFFFSLTFILLLLLI